MLKILIALILLTLGIIYLQFTHGHTTEYIEVPIPVVPCHSLINPHDITQDGVVDGEDVAILEGK